MSQEKPGVLPEEVSEYEGLLCKLPGIVQARFILDEERRPVELHILADRSRNPKQIVRDVQSAMVARFGVEVDHRIISVAQADLPLPASANISRLVCGEVLGRVSRGGRFTARVTLEEGDREFIGEAAGSDLPYNKRMIVAQATIMAVESFLGQQDLFTVTDVESAVIAGQQAILVAIALHDQQHRDLLIGAVCDQGDLNATVVKATLDAVNRRIQVLQI